MEMQFASVWESIADRIPDAPALRHGDTRWSWRQFDSRAARLARALADLGLGPDAKVAQYLYNGPEYIEVCYAAFKLRGVPINVNYRYLADELAYLIDNSDSEALFFHGSLGERVQEVRARLPRLRALVQVDDGSPLLDGALRYEDLIASHPPADRIARSGDEICMLYTGGTTGMPKGVMYRHCDLCGNLLAGFALRGLPRPERADEIAPLVAELHQRGGSPRTVAACPLMHGTGLWGGAFSPLNAGGTVITLTQVSFDPDELWRAVQRERATDVVIVGDSFAKPMARALEEAEARGEPYDISTLRFMLSSGVMWTAQIKEALLRRGDMILIDAMGATEGGMAQQISSRGAPPKTGKFQLNPTSRVFTEDGREVRPGSGEIGMLAVSGNIPLGYYKDPEKSARTFREIAGARYSIPGDFATVEADGTITLLGRGSICINTGGEKVYPEEVEEVVKLHPAVDDCLVVGVPDEKFGETVAAVASPRPGRSARPEEVLAFTRGKLASYKLPKRLVWVDRVRRAANGKGDYPWARAQAQA